MKPTLGRIVLVTDPRLLGEVPAIVTRVNDDATLNVQAFTNSIDGTYFLHAVRERGDPIGATYGWRWGWRWPPREPVPHVEHTPAVDAARELASV